MLIPSRATKAFTLLELIVVIVILGLLAALAIPTFARVTSRSRDAVTKSTIASVLRDAQALVAFQDGTSWAAATETAAKETPARAGAPGTSAAGALSVAGEARLPSGLGELTYQASATATAVMLLSAPGRVCYGSTTSSARGVLACADVVAGAVVGAGASGAAATPGEVFSDALAATLPGTATPTPGATTPPTPRAKQALLDASPAWYLPLTETAGASSAVAAVPSGTSLTPSGSTGFDGTGLLVGASGRGQVDTPAWSLTGTSSYSVVASYVPSTTSGAYSNIYSSENASATSRYAVQVGQYQGRYVCERIVNGSGVNAWGGAPAVGVKDDLVCTYDGSALRLYVNGTLADTQPDTRSLVATGVSRLGATTQGADAYYGRGRISHAAGFSRALSAAEVASFSGKVLPSATARASALAASNPLWWYRFNEAAGASSAQPSVGSSSAAPSGSVTFGSSGTTSSASAATLGASGYGRFQTPAFDPLGTSSFSVLGWVRPSVSDASFRPFFTNEASTGSTTDGRPRFQVAAYNGKYSCERVTVGGAGVVQGGTASPGVAAFVACTYDGATVRLYVDGILVGSATDTATNNVATGKSFVGAVNNNPSPYFWKGTVEDVAVYYRALSSADLTALKG
jgi:prepilin-type N-terminal cleavage/methylation domain-containing protein